MILDFRPRAAELAVDGDHRQLHDVGRPALYRRVHRIPLGQRAHDRIARADVGQHPLAAEQSRHVTLLAGIGDHPVDVRRTPG